MTETTQAQPTDANIDIAGESADRLDGGLSPPLDIAKAVYAEAGHWVRLVNTIAWTTAALLVPTSVACVGVAIAHPTHRVILTVGSFGALALWIAIMQRYGWSAKHARETLITIEHDWKLLNRQAFYTSQQTGGPGRAAVLFQVGIALSILAAWVWVYVFT